MIDCGLIGDKEVSIDQNVNLEQKEIIKKKLKVVEELEKNVLVSQNFKRIVCQLGIRIIVLVLTKRSKRKACNMSIN